MEDHEQDLARRLHHERWRLSFTLADLASLSGVERSRLERIEEGGGERALSAAELAALAHAGLDVAYLLTGTQTLNQEEGALIGNYRDSTPAQKENAATLGNAAAKSPIIGN